ncbi:MAG: hypothetical protein SCK29_09960 [Bacillota bacterium]|nr:hypothetical protein [Bacillota bacterium]MDW7684425.1 hypothetical protein [Bacillota bacterium]
MLYFVGYTPNEGGWAGSFNRAVRSGLEKLCIPFVELPPFDWSGPAAPMKEYLRVRSKPDDAWFIGWAQSPVIELIHSKPGRKYGLVVGLTEMHFDPMVFTGRADTLREKERLGLYDGLFANSHWCCETVSRAYPKLSGRTVTTGFPFDFTALKPYRKLTKEKNLVVFNQRFSPERLHSLEIEAARLLIAMGYRVQHLLGVSPAQLSKGNPLLKSLIKKAQHTGIEFVYNAGKTDYHQRLARASLVITTSIADMLPSSLIEAIYLGAVPVAPRAFCFPEFVHTDNLYTPYDLAEILSVVTTKPRREHQIQQYAKDKVVSRFIEEMKLT